jgi:hypothetical protein
MSSGCKAVKSLTRFATLAGLSVTFSIQSGADAWSISAVMVSISAVMVIVMIVVSVLVYPEHALDAANYATGHPADSTAHDPADRSGRIIAGAGSLPRTLSDALSLCRKRHCKKSYHASNHHKTGFHDASLSGYSFRASGIVLLRYPVKTQSNRAPNVTQLSANQGTSRRTGHSSFLPACADNLP